MHLQPVFRAVPRARRRVAEELFATGLCLPERLEPDRRGQQACDRRRSLKRVSAARREARTMTGRTIVS